MKNVFKISLLKIDVGFRIKCKQYPPPEDEDNRIKMGKGGNEWKCKFGGL